MKRLVGVLSALAVAAVVPAAIGQAPTDELTGEHSLDGRSVRLCVSVLDAAPRDQSIWDIDIYSSANGWLPPSTTPQQDFRLPRDWRAEPTSGPVDPDGWRFLPPGPLPQGEYCITIPLRDNQLPTAIEFVATNEQHKEIKRFTSTLRVADAQGAVPRRFTLGQGEVAAAAVFRANGPTCGLPGLFEEVVGLTTEGSTISIRRPGAGVVSGPVASNGTFRGLHSETEAYTGGITGTDASVSYAITRAACTALYTAQLTLERPGRSLPRCARPTIVAPSRAAVVAGARVPLRIGATCAGSRLSNWPMRITLRDRGRTFSVGAFRTRLAPRAVTVRLGSTRPRELVVTAGGGQGLRAATKRIRLIYG